MVFYCKCHHMCIALIFFLVISVRQKEQGEFNAALVPRLKNRDSLDERHDALSSDEDVSLLASGNGILEFSPQKAGLDVTPANLDFGDGRGDQDRKSSQAPLSIIAGKYQTLSAIFTCLNSWLIPEMPFNTLQFNISSVTECIRTWNTHLTL